MTNEEAISWFENRMKNTTMPGARRMFAMALDALRTQQERERNEPLTNADQIRGMSDEELAKMLVEEKEYGIAHEKYYICP